MPNQFKIAYFFIILALGTLLSSCSTLSYYGQSMSGHLQLLRSREDVHSVLQSIDTPDELKHRLKSISRIRDFASHTLGLPDNSSYRSYADIGRKFVVWNVFATPALSFEPKTSCFLIVGCLSYRGYFKKDDAVKYMESLKDNGFDIYLGGVMAYSTLGWFDDPILNGMLERNDFDLARLIFHELAHQQLYIKDDTEFNEAFADAVALIGLGYWLEINSTIEQKRNYEHQLARENQFIDLVLSYRDKLDLLYRTDISLTKKHLQKEEIYEDLQNAYVQLRSSWGEHSEYDSWFAQGVSNAKLSAISTYRKLVPFFLQAYRTTGENMEAFYTRIEAIGLCEAERRRELLLSISSAISCNPE
ncbi:MAG: aminopeptidase [Gammaproteobacteria bacterium]|jgi:predicted aminopeptidase|nr:aminopeptidase [Gammaproteobacteria bacterium]